MNKSPQKQNEIKLDGSQLLGHNAQGIVMVAGTKPVGKKPLGKKQKVIKLDESKLLGHNAQGIVMAGPKPAGTVKPTIGTKPLGKKQNAIKLDGSKLLGHNAQGIVMAGQPKPSGTKMVAIKPIIGTKPSNPGPKPFAG